MLYNRRMSIEVRYGRLQESIESKPEKQATPDRKIHTGNARRSAFRLLKGLDDLGAQISEPKISIINIPVRREKQLDETWSITRSTASISTGIPHAIESPLVQREGKMDVVSNVHMKWVGNSAYYVSADVLLDNQSFHILSGVEPKVSRSYSLSIATSTELPSNKELLLESLPTIFNSIGFLYDLKDNPQHKERLSAVARKRIPAEIVQRDRRSSAIGLETPEGIDASIRLFLQNPNPQNFLKCYEVEIFSEGTKNSPNTPKVAPETIWQPKENHYCMAEGDSYPFVPIEIDKLSRLAMTVRYAGDSPQAMFDLLGDLPLSMNWANQWYATTGDSQMDSLGILYKPEWGKGNARFVYRKTSSERITPQDIRNILTQMNAVKKDTTERLALA